MLRRQSVTDPQSPGWRLRQVHMYRCQRSRRGLHSVWCQSAMWVRSPYFVVQLLLATFHNEKLFKLFFSLLLTVPPTIRGTDSDFPDEVTVLVNKTTQLECHVDGNPAPKITWFKDSQPFSSDGPHRILSNGRILQVSVWEHRKLFYVSQHFYAFQPSAYVVTLLNHLLVQIHRTSRTNTNI